MESMNLQYGIGSAHSTGPQTPLTPIIYGNGTLLSDIGEVTEVESTVGRRTPKPRPVPLKLTSYDAGPSSGYNARTGNHQRRVSIESTSTITSGPRTAIFADIDDSLSVDDSVFQGDDEESVAEDPYRNEYEMPAHLAQALSRKESIISSTTITSDEYDEEAQEDPGDKYSSGALSRRAELILANAKKRLDVSI